MPYSWLSLVALIALAVFGVGVLRLVHRWRRFARQWENPEALAESIRVALESAQGEAGAPVSVSASIQRPQTPTETAPPTPSLATLEAMRGPGRERGSAEATRRWRWALLGGALAIALGWVLRP